MSQPANYPNFVGKHAHDAFIRPEDHLSYLRSRGLVESIGSVDGVVLLYQRSLLNRVLEREAGEVHKGWVTGDFRSLERNGQRVGVCGGFGIGAPIVAIVMEELIALGVRRFIAIGTAGTLQDDVSIGDVVVCRKAVRDEGVSHHYVASAKYAHPSAALTHQLMEALEDAGCPYRSGDTWTIDTPYRETVAEARHYQAEDVLTVEMEASAVFAVAEHRGADAASAFAVSDSLAGAVWDPQFDSAKTHDALDALFDAAVDALQNRS